MHKGLISSVSFLILINLIIKPIYILGIDREVQNVLGPESYGIFFALFNFTYLFHIINDFGIQSYNARFIAQNKSLVQSTTQQFLGIKMILGLVYFLLVAIATWLLGYDVSLYRIIVILAFNHICIGFVFYLRTNLTGLAMYRQDAWLSIMDRGLLIIIVGALLYVPVLQSYLSLNSFILAQTGALLISIVTGLIMLGKNLPNSIRINTGKLVNSLKRTWPYAVTVFLMTLYTRLDGVMIERLFSDGKTEAGIYASGYRLLDAANMVIFLFASLLLPQLSEAWNQNQKLKQLFVTGFRMLFVVCITVVLISYFFSHEIMLLLYDSATDYWGDVFHVLMLTYLSIGIIYLFSTYITASGKLKRMNGWFILGIVANLSLNFILIPQHGALGAAYATLATQSLVAIGLIMEGRQCLKYLSEISWVRLIGFVLILIALFYFSSWIQIHIILKITFLGAIAVGFSLLLNIIPASGIRNWLSNK